MSYTGFIMSESNESKQDTSFLGDAQLTEVMNETMDNLGKADLGLSNRCSTNDVLQKLELVEPLMKELALAFAERLKHDHVSNLAGVLTLHEKFVQFVFDNYKDQEVRVAGFYPAALLQYACTSSSIAHLKFYFASEVLTRQVSESESGYCFNMYRIGDLEFAPHALRQTLTRWLNKVIPEESDVHSLVDATEMMYSMILIGREWRSLNRPELEKSSRWIPWQALIAYTDRRDLEKLIAKRASDVTTFGLDDLVAGTRDAKGYYSVCEVLFERLKQYRRFWESRDCPKIG